MPSPAEFLAPLDLTKPLDGSPRAVVNALKTRSWWEAASLRDQGKVEFVRSGASGLVKPRISGQTSGKPLAWDGGHYDNAGRAYTLAVYADLVQVNKKYVPTQQPDGIGGRRGFVSRFSAASRLRFLQDMAKARDLDAMAGYFVTLTYPDLCTVSSERNKADLHAFRKAIERYFEAQGYKVGGWWRMELKERRSGLRRGSVVPHFHLILYSDAPHLQENTVPYEQFRYWLTDTWGRIVQNHQFAATCGWLLSRYPSLTQNRFWLLIAFYLSRSQTLKNRGKYFKRNGWLQPYKHGAGTNVWLINNRRHAMSYASKYAAKEEAQSCFNVGRRWGRIGSTDQRTFFLIDLSHQRLHMLGRYLQKLLINRPRVKYKMRRQRYKGYSLFGFGALSNKPPDGPYDYDDSLISRLLDHVLIDGQVSSVKF